MSELHRVARRGDPLRVRELLEAGADPNEVRVRTGERPLHLAASSNDWATVSVLLEFGADINLADKRGNPPLWSARTKEMQERLLGAGADADAGAGMTLAAFLTEFGDKKRVQLLLDYGADPETKLLNGRTIREVMNDPAVRSPLEVMNAVTSPDRRIRTENL